MIKKILIIGAKLGISVALILYVLRDVSIAALRQQVSGLDGVWLAAAMGCMVLQFAPMILRFGRILERFDIPCKFSLVSRAVGAMTMGNQILPAGAGGDGLRILVLHRAGAGTLLRLGAAVMADRIMALVGLVVLMGAFLPFLPQPDRAGAGLIDSVRLVSLLLLLGVAGFYGLLALVRTCPALLAKLLAGRIAALWSGLRLIFVRRWAGQTLIEAILVHLLSCAAVLCLARALGLSADMAMLAVLTVPVLLTLAIPLTIGGWGIRELVFTELLALIAIDAPAAVGIGVLFGGLQIAQALCGAGLMLGLRAVEGRS